MPQQIGRPVRLNDWRMRLAQWLLSRLYGRPWHHISPWSMAAVGAGLVMLNPKRDKVLLQQRAGHIESSGRWGTFGGYLNLNDHEEPRQALSREVWEECGRRPDPASLPPRPDYTPLVYNQTKILMEQHHGVSLYWFAQVPENLVRQLKPSEETSGFAWFTQAQVQELWDTQQFTGRPNDQFGAVMAAFAAATAAQPLPMLHWLNETLSHPH